MLLVVAPVIVVGAVGGPAPLVVSAVLAVVVVGAGGGAVLPDLVADQENLFQRRDRSLKLGHPFYMSEKSSTLQTVWWIQKKKTETAKTAMC